MLHRRKNSSQKVQTISGQQVVQTFRTEENTEALYLVFCTQPYGHPGEYVQPLCTFSELQFLCIFPASARNLFQ